MNVAKNVATTVVDENANLRLGLTAFNTNQGGRVLQNCATGNTAALKTDISALTPSTWTPLGEALYEVTRYFRGLDGYYNDVDYDSPIQYRCQKNFVIVITDGYPTQDTDFPADDPADPDGLLPDWDGIATPTTAAEYPNFLSGSDGFQPSGVNTDEGFSLYLDDIAKFAYDIDLRTGEDDDTDVSFDEAPFEQQNLVTYTVGFAVANQMMDDAATNGTGRYYQANDEAELTAALQAALADIEARTSSAASVATNSTRLASDTFIYQARFSTSDWGGQLLAYPIGAGGEVGVLADEPGAVPELPGRSGWDAAQEIPAAGSRNIYTYDPATNSGMDFQWASLTDDQRTELDGDGNGEKRLEYLRGDQQFETPNAPGFRRRSSILGDIINSDPAYVGKQNYGFELLPGDEGSTYKAYRKSSAYQDRTPMVYVASNDGMLHGFSATTGAELLAFVPNAVYPELTAYSDTSFNLNHRLINDGTPRALDAYIGGAWGTVLVGTLGGGGKGVYALNVTNPDGFDESDVLWEFTSEDDSNMGVAIPEATIGRMYNGMWAAVVANGYNSGGNATLFILDLATGDKLAELDTGVGDDNGLSSPTPVDVDGDRITDYIYAGDLKGNMWKFDVTSDDPADWEVAFEGEPLYTACSEDPCTDDNRQPITARPEVGISPPAGYFVYFGTGRYFAVGDNGVGTGDNTVYAIRDKNAKGTPSPVLPTAGRSTLLEQVIETEQLITFGAYREWIRTSSKNTISDYQDGWYLDLPTTGERQVSNTLLRAGRLIFTTVIPSGDQCSAGGESWLMEIDALTGSRLTESPFDFNRDRAFDIKDWVPKDPNDPDGEKIPASGRKGSQGIMKGLGIVADGDTIEYKYGSGSLGGIDTTIESAGRLRGRQSWREIQ